jgi:hypothetical protein
MNICASVVRSSGRPVVLVLLASVLLLGFSTATVSGRQPRVATARLIDAVDTEFVADTDSNSPALWDLENGGWLFFVLNSSAGRPQLTAGRMLGRLAVVAPVNWIDPAPPGGVWMEAVVADAGGTWYGYFHNEMVGTVCQGSEKAIPRIGAARSTDRGRTWQDLGPILEASPGSTRCSTRNKYFLGGVGDFSVALDAGRDALYFFYTQYSEPTGVGVSVARMSWAARDRPAGEVMVWQAGAWLPPDRVPLAEDEETDEVLWLHRMATPIHPATSSWDDGDRAVDVFWGPSVHWNTHLESWVMLLNRASSDDWKQEGVYVSFSALLENPEAWSAPAELLKGGRWYPQVIGLEQNRGTDKEAGETARFFMGGQSSHLIRFARS